MQADAKAAEPSYDLSETLEHNDYILDATSHE
jgi:hypothetical protein